MLRKGRDRIIERVGGKWFLRGCDCVGRGARVQGWVRVTNRGAMRIGRQLFIMSRWIPTELISQKGGEIAIGDRVWINFGTLISAHCKITIGDNVMIGQHCIVSDTEFPDMPIADDMQRPLPIEIGDDVWLAARVTVRPGVKIGKGANVVAGSIVESDIPPGVVAGGIPARPISRVGEHEAPASLAEPATTRDVAQQSIEQRVDPTVRGYLVSDFTIDELRNELRLSDLHPGVDTSVAPFGQFTQSLLALPPADSTGFLVAWTLPQIAIPTFARLLAFEPIDDGMLLAEVDTFCSKIEAAAPAYRAVFVPTWTIPSWERGFGLLDMRSGGVSAALNRMNLELTQRLSALANVYVLDASRWMSAVGPAAYNAKAWYMGKMAFGRPALAEAASEIRSALSAISGGPRKLLIVDLDETLWGGVVGDVGWQGLKLGGLDASGEAFADFQHAIKDLKNRGVILGIVSKNEETVALEAIRNHPSMVLREADFVGWKINWNDKAQNIAELTQSLNLGLQSVVFIDDNPFERARVKEALPEVYVPQWPKEEFLYASVLRNLRCFDAPTVSREDAARTRMYSDETQREALRQQVGSIDEWLQTLEIKVEVAKLGPLSSSRAAQLLNKTNQLNLTTRRLTESELLSWAAEEGNAFWVVSVSDRMGDSGLTGLLGMTFDGDNARIIDFVLSCRVMGRRVEETIVHVAVVAAIKRGASRVVAEYLPTPKNKPCLAFWRSSGFSNQDDKQFTWDCQHHYKLPGAIRLEWNE